MQRGDFDCHSQGSSMPVFLFHMLSPLWVCSALLVALGWTEMSPKGHNLDFKKKEKRASREYVMMPL